MRSFLLAVAAMFAAAPLPHALAQAPAPAAVTTVLSMRDGLPLPESEGPLALVSLKDTRPGPRHVKWLRSIELRTLAN
jgi:hypothetical protein